MASGAASDRPSIRITPGASLQLSHIVHLTTPALLRDVGPALRMMGLEVANVLRRHPQEAVRATSCSSECSRVGDVHVAIADELRVLRHHDLAVRRRVVLVRLVQVVTLRPRCGRWVLQVAESRDAREQTARHGRRRWSSWARTAAAARAGNSSRHRPTYAAGRESFQATEHTAPEVSAVVIAAVVVASVVRHISASWLAG